MHLTPTDKRFLEILKDGRRHKTHEFHAALDDCLSSVTAVYTAMSTLRRKLERCHNQTIVCVYYKKNLYYQQFQYITPPPTDE